jgi:hypothetical protein
MEELEWKNNDGGQPMTVRIIGGKREEASSEGQQWRYILCSRTLKHLGKKTPFIVLKEN